MTSMFWGLRMEPGKRYTTTVGRSFHVSMAALDCATVKNENEINSVMLQEGENDVPFILCNLQKQKNLQCPLDLNFLEGDNVTFFCKGNGTIHLSGYVHEDPDELPQMDEEDDEMEDEENEDLEDEEEDVEDLKKALKELGKKRKKANGLPEGSAVKKAKSDDDDGSEDDDDLDDLDDSDLDDEEEDSQDEEEEEEDEEVPAQKIDNKKKQKNKGQNEQAVKANGTVEQPQLSKKQKKKAKLEAAAAAAGSPKTEVSPKKDGGLEKKTLQGGVQIKDLVVGKGQPAKPGQKVQVYYVGRLKSNNKVFDQTKKGNGFAFSLGKGEVIKGWDVGVAGMKVGGKRTITCPANMAYGQKGSPPVIPPNSTLVFEVELRSVQ